MASWYTSAFESVFGVGAVESMTPPDVLARLPVSSKYSQDESTELFLLAENHPMVLVRKLDNDGLPKWARAIEASIEAGTARDERHRSNIDQTARDIQRDASKVGKRGASWLPVVGIVAAVVLLTRSGKR
jgi:hypothetical protein